jgi:hypothetical protein
MEERWYTPLKTIHTTRSMENNQTLHFTRRLTGDEAEEEEANGPGPTDPLQLFKRLSNWNPPRPSTPMHFTDARIEIEDEYSEGVMTQVIAGCHEVCLCLDKHAVVERVIKVFQRSIGVEGK